MICNKNSLRIVEITKKRIIVLHYSNDNLGKQKKKTNLNGTTNRLNF